LEKWATDGGDKETEIALDRHSGLPIPQVPACRARCIAEKKKAAYVRLLLPHIV